MDRNIVYRNNRFMRKGYTTGTCAAAASYGAAMILLNGTVVNKVPYTTPDGTQLELELCDIVQGEGYVSCAVRKDSGDDPDVTKDTLIYSRVELIPDGVIIDGGKGIGRVTREGLDQPVGAAAINSVPRRSIESYVRTAAEEVEYKGGFKVTIYAPDGEALAKRTLNPDLGIEGGISILGTTGIVEPMSRKALKETIGLEMNILSLKYKNAVAVPGNYGLMYARDIMGIPSDRIIKTSNYIGTAIDFAVEKELNGLLIVGHIGKAVKLGAGIMNTHSYDADGRLEILCASAIKAGCDVDNLKKIVDCVTTDEAIDILDSIGLREKVMENLMEKIHFYITRRSCGVKTGAVVFSNRYGLLGKTAFADEIIEAIKAEEEK